MNPSETFRFSDAYPELGREPVTTEPYYSTEFFEKERRSIFERCWINVGRTDEIPEAGDYFVRELHVCRTSLLVVRGKDGRIRAFHNMCSHRGNPVAWESRGRCRGLFVCRFHAWSYDSEGRLVNINDESRFFDVDKDANGLTSIALDTWQGFIFVCLDPEPRQSLEDYLEPASAAMHGYPFDQLHLTYKYEARERVNWKLLQEAQLEGWHVPYLHKQTLAKTVAQDGKLFRHAAIKRFGFHTMVSSHAPENYQPTPAAALSMKYGTGAFDAFAVETADDTDQQMKWHGAFDLYHLFPNTFIGLLRGTFFTYNIWPLAVDESIWEVRFYYPKPRNAGELFSLEYGKCGLRDALREDAFTHEKIQSVIASGAKRVFHLQDEELAVRHFCRVVGDHVNNEES